MTTIANTEHLVKYFTQRGFNLTEQGRIYREDRSLYENLKQRGKMADRDYADKLRSIEQQIENLKEQRRMLIERGI